MHHVYLSASLAQLSAVNIRQIAYFLRLIYWLNCNSGGRLYACQTLQIRLNPLIKLSRLTAAYDLLSPVSVSDCYTRIGRETGVWVGALWVLHACCACLSVSG